jgi:hypothetical protein
MIYAGTIACRPGCDSWPLGSQKLILCGTSAHRATLKGKRMTNPRAWLLMAVAVAAFPTVSRAHATAALHVDCATGEGDDKYGTGVATELECGSQYGSAGASANNRSMATRGMSAAPGGASYGAASAYAINADYLMLKGVPRDGLAKVRFDWKLT